MRQLVYVSASTRKPTDLDLEEILTAARRNNPACDVTGMLLYIDRGFLQVLEGPPAGVEAVYARILGDRRHTAQRVLIDQPCDQRLFAQWSMGFDRPDPKRLRDADIFAVTRDAIENAVPPEKAAVIAQLLRTFYVVNAGNQAS